MLCGNCVSRFSTIATAFKKSQENIIPLSNHGHV